MRQTRALSACPAAKTLKNKLSAVVSGQLETED
jgi:hypothetical protein